jgi:hypothetical protein
MKLRNFALFAVLCALVLPAYGAGPMKAGKWQTTLEMEMPGMPMNMPPVSYTTCITKEQAENAESAIPKGQQDNGCTYSDVKVDGNNVSWTMSCEKQQMTGTGKATYADDRFTGVMQMKMQDHEMKAKYSGKRLGDCDK